MYIRNSVAVYFGFTLRVTACVIFVLLRKTSTVAANLVYVAYAFALRTSICLVKPSGY